MNGVVPSRALLWLAALAGLPLATAAGLGGGVGGAALLALAALALTASLDAFLALPRLRRVTVTAPPVLHGAKTREVPLELELHGLEVRADAALSWPAALSCTEPLARVTPADAVAKWTVRLLERGRHRLSALYLECASPLGLWRRRKVVPLELEVHVFPDLRRERRGLAAIFLNRESHGFHNQAQIGKGREFDHLREYVAGDDYGDIHWKTTARRGFPVTKTFQIERTREVYAIVDHSRLSGRTLRQPLDPAAEVAATERGHLTGGDAEITTQLERAIESALVLGLAAEKQHDHFGLVTFADRVTRFVRSGSGKAHYNSCRQALFNLQTQPVAPDFEELFVHLRRTLTRRALIIILTDLSDPLQAESFAQSLRLVSRQHLVLVSMIRPETATPLFSRADVETPADVYRDLAGHFLWHDLQEIGKVLGQQGVHFGLADSTQLTADVVSRYMQVKQRQLL